MKKKTLLFVLCLFFSGCALMILWCERLQFESLHSKRMWAFGGLGLFCGVLFFSWLCFIFLPSRVQFLGKKECVCVTLCAMIAAVCGMVWFSLPNSGIWETHELVVTNLSAERSLTLTWLRTERGEQSLRTFFGNAEKTDVGLVIPPSEKIRWKGLTGKSAVVEFASDPQGGTAVFSWDGREQVISLYQDTLERVSYEVAFPPSFGLPEFLAWFFLLSLLCFALLVGALTAQKRPSFKLVFTVAALCFALFRLAQFRMAEGPLFFVDSESYIGVSEMSVEEIFKGKPFCYPEENLTYCISRPAVIPLLYKICGQNNEVIAWAQLVLSVFCWNFFAVCVASVLRRPLWKKAALITLLGLGCIPNVTRWDLFIMTESLTLGLGVDFFGALLCLTGKSDLFSRKTSCLLTLIFGLLLIPTRDSSGWIVLLCGVLLLVLWLFKGFEKCFLLTGIGLILFSVVNMLGTDDRWQFPFENVIFARILRDPEATEYFYASGMPHPDGIESLYGTEHLQGSALFNSPEMEPLREWILRDGLKTYIRYLLRTPMEALRMTWYSGFEREAFEETDYFFTPFGFRSLMPEALVKFFSFNVPGILVILLGLWDMVRVFTDKKGAVFAVPALLLLSAYLLVSAVLLIDTYDFARHALVNVILLKAAAWVSCWLILDARSNQRVDPLL